MAAYANQIQVLALRDAELEGDNRHLRALAGQSDATIIPMSERTLG